MQRRSLLKLGAGSAVLLAIAGGSLALVQPGLNSGRLSAGARDLFAAVARAVLQGSLPIEPARRDTAVADLLERIEALVAALPDHAQDELSQLLALLAIAPGRAALAGLHTPWAKAEISELQRALQSMRVSGLALRRQAYQALHDIVTGAYFADASTWAMLGYPGPVVA
jgi:hypothetical protein